MAKRGNKPRGRSNEESKIKQFIAKEVERERQNEFPTDDEFAPPSDRFEDNGRYMESAGRISSEERVLDELLMSVPQNQGYYLKLYKELRPNEYELKERIDNWIGWSDMEWEVTQIVRAHSLKEPKKWGTSKYRVIIWRDGGLRGDKFRPLDFYVDAQEPTPDAPVNVGGVSPVTSMMDNFAHLNEMLKTMREVNPTMNPADVQKTAMESFQQGLGLALKKEENNSNSSMQMMTVMMQGMMTMMTAVMQNKNSDVPHKDPVEQFTQMMSIIKADQPKQESLMEQIIKMRELGLINKPEAVDPMDQMAKMRDMFSMVTDLAGIGKGERPGIGEKLVEILAPKVPEMIGNISSTVKGFIDYQKMKIGMAPSNPKPIASIDTTATDQPTTTQEQEDPQVFFGRLLNELHQIVTNNDTNQYPYIQAQITKLFGNDQVLKDLASGAVQQSQILNQLRTFGGSAYQNATFSVQLDNYFSNFVEWYRQTNHIGGSSSASANTYVVRCNSCGGEFEYDSEHDFEVDTDKTCTDCQGGMLVGVGFGHASLH